MEHQSPGSTQVDWILRYRRAEPNIPQYSASAVLPQRPALLRPDGLLEPPISYAFRPTNPPPFPSWWFATLRGSPPEASKPMQRLDVAGIDVWTRMMGAAVVFRRTEQTRNGYLRCGDVLRFARSRLNYCCHNHVVRAAWRNSIMSSEKTQFTLQLTANFRAPPLEKSCAQIEAVADQEQRHGQAGSTKHSDWFQTFDINLNSRHAPKRSCDSGHYDLHG
jgi:hypothetical protein